jgi:hypothetical protein
MAELNESAAGGKLRSLLGVRTDEGKWVSLSALEDGWMELTDRSARNRHTVFLGTAIMAVIVIAGILEANFGPEQYRWIAPAAFIVVLLIFSAVSNTQETKVMITRWRDRSTARRRVRAGGGMRATTLRDFMHRPRTVADARTMLGKTGRVDRIVARSFVSSTTVSTHWWGADAVVHLRNGHELHYQARGMASRTRLAHILGQSSTR